MKELGVFAPSICMGVSSDAESRVLHVAMQHALADSDALAKRSNAFILLHSAAGWRMPIL